MPASLVQSTSDEGGEVKFLENGVIGKLLWLATAGWELTGNPTFQGRELFDRPDVEREVSQSPRE
jgi:hypothetical protein